MKIRHLLNRARLIIDHGFYPEYLRRQGVRIGRNTVIVHPSYIDGRLPYLLEIGNNVVISRHVTILTHDAATAFAGDMIKIARVTINDHCFIGAGSTILCGCAIGPDVIVGAGAVVTGDIPPRTVYAGNPARKICDLSEYTTRQQQQSSGCPFLLGHPYSGPYIDDTVKQYLRDQTLNGPAYFCSSLDA